MLSTPYSGQFSIQANISGDLGGGKGVYTIAIVADDIKGGERQPDELLGLCEIELIRTSHNRPPI